MLRLFILPTIPTENAIEKGFQASAKSNEKKNKIKIMTTISDAQLFKKLSWHRIQCCHIDSTRNRSFPFSELVTGVDLQRNRVDNE